ncbi:MAG: right-handed parallel beta-helix repeat-containing protein [Kiritimatiellaeota bacterium]|nr:right-handed parallel beta-helix repeat-containing protein [Kiritimatiellota bacterium]
MIRVKAFIMVAMAAAAMAASAEVKKIYVSPDGKDSGSGSSWRPFATFARAQQAVREAKQDGKKYELIEVLFAGGAYRLDAPVIIGAEDGGTMAMPVTYKARDAAKMPVLSGGRKITGWKVGADGAWSVTLPEVASGEWDFSQLWVDGVRRFRPKLPKTGYAMTVGAFEEQADKKACNGFTFEGDALGAVRANLGDVEIHTLHTWAASGYRVKDIDAAAKAVRFTVPHRTNGAWYDNFEKRRFWAENVKEAFGEPGEWYLDRPTGVLRYMPMPGERPDRAEVVAPVLAQLLVVRGTEDAPVVSTFFNGLQFCHSNWVMPQEGNYCPQAEMNISSSVEVISALGVTFWECVFRQLGGYAMGFGPGARGSVVQYCVMHDMGGGGVKIGAPYVGYVHSPINHSWDCSLEDSKRTLSITVRDCKITGGGRLHPAAHGVWVGQSSYNKVMYNEISDLFYTSVSLGWTWGYHEPSRAHDNEVAYNHMHTLGQGVLSDMGGVYTLGRSPNTTVHHNHIHDVHAFDYGGWGLYTDEGSTGIHLYNNLVYRVKTGGFHQHYGRDNIIENNIFAYSLTQQIQRTRNEEHLSFTFRNNIVLWDNDSPLLGGDWGGAKVGTADDGKATERYAFANNIYWHTSGKETLFPGNKTLAQWQDETGQDKGSIVQDPLFAAPDKGDFRFRSTEAIGKTGFKPFDVITTTGPREPKNLPNVKLPDVPSNYTKVARE